MNKLKIALLAYVLCSLTGCWSCLFISDCGNPDDRLPVYANKSGETVKIVSIVRDYRHHYYEKFIANGDTLHYETESMEDEWFVPYIRNCGLIVYWNCDEPIPIRMELHFLGEPEKCLIFDGPIKNDGFDMRSLSSYKRGKKIDNWADYWEGIEYVYTITSKHKEMAREEDCLSAERE
jgi:hypothetical protein